MSSFKYDGTRVNSAVDAINQISSKFSSLSTSIRSATNQIISARGFQEYVGGISSDTFSGYIDQCGAEIVNLSTSIRQKEVSILAYSEDSNAIGSFLNHLTNKEYQSLDLSELSSYIGLDRRAGNFAKGVGASALTFGLGVVEGVADFGETLVDTAALGLTGAASIFTGIYDFFTGSNTTKKMWENTKAYVSEKKVENAFNRFYDNNSFGQFLKQNAYGFDTVRGIGKGLGYTAGVIGLTAVTGGLAAGGIGSAGSITAGNLAATAGVLGFGNGTEEAWADGATLGKGLLYGAAAGAWEGAQWFAGAKINQFGGVGDQVAKGIFKGASSGVGTRIFMDTVDSGLEGFVQPALTMIYKDYGGANFVENYKTAFSAAGGWGNVATQAAIGAIGSTIGEISGARKLLKANDPGDLEDVGKAAGTAGVAAGAEGADQIFKSMGADGNTAAVTDSIGNAAKMATDLGDDVASSALKNGDVDFDMTEGTPTVKTIGGSDVDADQLFKSSDFDFTDVEMHDFIEPSPGTVADGLDDSLFPAMKSGDLGVGYMSDAGASPTPREKIKYTDIERVGPFDEQLSRVPPGTDVIEGTRIPRDAVVTETWEVYSYDDSLDPSFEVGLKKMEDIYGKDSIQVMSARSVVAKEKIADVHDMLHNLDDLETMNISDQAKVVFDGVGLPSRDYSFELDGRGTTSAGDALFAEDIAFWRNMSDADRAPMDRYTGGAYDPIGISLRSGTDLPDDLARGVGTLSRQLDSRPGLAERTILYRGMDSLGFVDESFRTMTPDQVVDSINKMANGTVVLGDNSFSSSTPFRNGGFSDKKVLEVCSVAPGTKGSYLGTMSHNGHESEFLLQAGTGNRKIILGADLFEGKIILYTAIP